MKKQILALALTTMCCTGAFAMSPDDVELNIDSVNCVKNCCYIEGEIENNSEEEIKFVRLKVYMYKDMEGEVSIDETYPAGGLDSVLAPNSSLEFKTRCLQKTFTKIPYKILIKLLWKDEKHNQYSKTYEKYP